MVCGIDPKPITMPAWTPRPSFMWPRYPCIVACPPKVQNKTHHACNHQEAIMRISYTGNDKDAIMRMRDNKNH